MSSRDFVLEDVDSIEVLLKTGKKMIYKGKGINRLFRTLVTTFEPEVVTFTEDDMERKNKKDEKKTSLLGGGYNVIPLQYEGSQGKSPQEIARQYQKQAEATADFKF